MRRILAVLLTLSVIALAATPAMATKLQHRNVDHMVKLAERIFVGECVEAVDFEYPLNGEVDVMCVKYTFQVLDDVRGNLGNTVEVRQLGRLEGQGAVVGMPTYKPGNKYLLFMLPESEIGLSSPVGLFQGAFEIYGDIVGGDAELQNSYQNVGVFHNSDVTNRRGISLSSGQQALAEQSKGAFEYSEFMNLIRQMAN